MTGEGGEGEGGEGEGGEIEGDKLSSVDHVPSYRGGCDKNGNVLIFQKIIFKINISLSVFFSNRHCSSITLCVPLPFTTGLQLAESPPSSLDTQYAILPLPSNIHLHH